VRLALPSKKGKKKAGPVPDGVVVYVRLWAALRKRRMLVGEGATTGVCFFEIFEVIVFLFSSAIYSTSWVASQICIVNL
jgi:hypothetical protein